MKSFFTLELAIEFYQISKDLKLPSHLRDQYLRACSSVSLNLSEGSAAPLSKRYRLTKPTKADRRKFYFVALGSMRECQCILRHYGQADPFLMKKADFLGACVYQLCQAVK